MQKTSIKSVAYTPGDPPVDPVELQRWLRQETSNIKAAIDALAAGHLDRQMEPPLKPRDGDIRFADGVSWDPGSGQGIYYFDGVVWNQLG